MNTTIKNILKSKGFRITAILSTFTLLVLGGFQVFLNSYVPRILRSQINHLVVEGSDSLYTCSVGKISVNVLRGNVAINDIAIEIDSAQYKKRLINNTLPNLLFNIKLKEGKLTGLKLYPLIISKKTIIHSIRADEAEIELSRQNITKKAEPKKIPSEQEMWSMIQSKINGIYIDRIMLDKIKLTYKSSVHNKFVDFAYESCSASFKNIRIDSTGAKNKNRIMFTEEFTIRLTGIHYQTKDSIYDIKLDTFIYSSFIQDVRLQGLSVHPLLTPEEITRRNKMQTDVVEADVDEIRMLNFKVEKILSNNEVNIDTVVVEHPSIKIHRDRTAHFDTTSQLGKFPLEILASAPVKVNIPTVLIDEAEVHYLEKQKATKIIADAGFFRVNGVVTNITNIPEQIAQNKWWKIRLTGDFIDQADLEVNVDFDLASETGDYVVDVKMGRVTADEMNKLATPFGNVRMKGLIMHNSHFKLTGDKNGATGSATVNYQDLYMEVLKVDKKTLEIRPDGFTTFMANMIAVRTNNMPGKNEVKATGIYVKRKYRQPFSHLILETFVEASMKVMVKVKAGNMKVEM